MVETRSIDQLQQEYLDALSRSGSGLIIDRVEGSLAYTMSRASAVLAARQDYQLQQLEDNFSILRATGEHLDQLGSFFLTRYGRRKANGWVLAQMNTGEQLRLPSGSTLIDLTTGNQYVTTASVTISPFVEVLIQIQAKDYGTSYNLLAGSILYSPENADLSLVVGYRRYNNNYQGDIVNGEEEETDANYRARLLNYFSSTPNGTASGIRNLLQQNPLVTRAFVRTSAPGFVEIWIESSTTLNQGALDSLYDYVRPYLMAGVVPVVSEIERVNIDFTLAVTPFQASRSDLSALSNQIRSSITEYFNALSLEGSLLVSELSNKLRPLARHVRILTPKGDYTPTVGQVLFPGIIEVSYPIN